MTDLPDLGHLADLHTGGELLLGEVVDVIAHAVANTPRSLQTTVGPSELGTECVRRLAYRMAGVPKTNDSRVAWKPAVGTAVHAALEDMFTAANAGQERARWLVETRVDVGEVAGVPVTGSADLYDLVTGTVVDFKVVGTASLRAKRAAGHPGRQYATQLHLYGRGFRRRGLPVTSVAILAVPQNGELHEAWWWTEEYDEQVAVDALTRATTVAGLVAAAGPAAAAGLPTADAWCAFCPWHLPAADPGDLDSGCPGHAGRQQRREAFAGIVPPANQPLKETA